MNKSTEINFGIDRELRRKRWFGLIIGLCLGVILGATIVGAAVI